MANNKLSAMFFKLTGVSVLRKPTLKQKIEKIWQGKEAHELKFDELSLYHRAMIPEVTDLVSEATWFDLDMNSVFKKIDRTISVVGAQYLYHKMFCYQDSQDSLQKKLSEGIRLIEDTENTMKMAEILYPLRGRSAAYISSVIFENLPEKPKYYLLLILLSLVFISSVVGLVFFGKAFLLVVIGIAILNTAINQMISFKISDSIPDMGSLGRLLAVASALARKGDTRYKEIKILKNHFKLISYLQKKFGWLLIDTKRLDDLSASVIAYLNHLLLVNLIIFFSASKYVNKHKKEFKEIFCAIASLDVSLGMANFLSTEICCFPTIVDENRLEVTKIYHPILEEPVSNTFQISDKSALITGSNMAGKTTFIKTIGVNLLLTRTLGFCFAESAIFPNANVFSTIRRRDNLLEGKSYYYVEIETLLEFIKVSDSEKRCLFLIDEIFRGTNTVERLAASSSVLKYLGNRSMVLVTTHDIELEKMVENKYSLFHFEEQIKDGIHSFDYLIKQGPCKSRNAIHLLEISGYPQKIIIEASSTAENLLNR